MKKLVMTALSGFLALGILGPTHAAEFTIRATHEMAAQDAINIAITRFAERVAERTGGRVEIKIFPAAQIGHDNDTLEQARQGASLIIVTNPGGAAGSDVPDVAVLDGPYLFDTFDDYRTLIKSDWFNSIADELEQKARLKLLAVNWLFGVRHFISDKPIRTPADVKGLKMRIPPIEMWVETFGALEANAQAINWGEVYTALSSGVVDAVEAPLESIWAAKFYEVKKTISLTGHMTNWIAPIMSADVFDALPADIQEILLEEAEIGGEIITALALDRERGFREKLEGEGVTFVEDIDRQAFAAKSAAAYDAIKQWTPGLYGTVRAAMGE